MHIHFNPQISLMGIYLKENRQKYDYAWVMLIDTLIIAKMGENINADQLLNEVGCISSMDYLRCRHSKGDVRKNISQGRYIHTRINIHTRAHSKHTHKKVRIYTETLIALISRESLCQPSRASKAVFFSFLGLFDIWLFHIWHMLSLCRGEKWL